jgi:beta-lactam-binding protein with PASTA domain
MATTMIGVPQLVGKPRSQAVDELTALGLKANVQEVLALGTEDTVYNQIPTPPATKPAKSVVTIQIIRNPVTQADFNARFDKLDATVAVIDGKVSALDAKVVTEAAATQRHQEVLTAIQGGGGTTPTPGPS